MKPKARFIASIVKTSKTEMPSLPYQRGSARSAFIAKRDVAKTNLKSA